MYWKEWLKMLLGLTTLLGVVELLLPPGDIAKFSKLVLGLVLMLAMLQPLTIIFSNGLENIDLTWLEQNYPKMDLLDKVERIQVAAAKPFLEVENENSIVQIESLLLTLESIEDVEVHVRDEGFVAIKIKPFRMELANRVTRIVEGTLGIPANRIEVVEEWSEQGGISW